MKGAPTVNGCPYGAPITRVKSRKFDGSWTFQNVVLLLPTVVRTAHRVSLLLPVSASTAQEVDRFDPV